MLCWYFTEKMSYVPALRVQRRFAQMYRKHLEARGIWQPRFRVHKYPDGTVALPIVSTCLPELDLNALQLAVSPGSAISLMHIQQAPTPSKRESVTSSNDRLVETLKDLLASRGERWSEELREDVPCRWQRHGDLVLLWEDCFSRHIWKSMGVELWQAVVRGLGVKRLGRVGRVSSDKFRTPVVTMLLGEDSIVTRVDNRIRYEFDVTKCMFSSGNITEKLRIASFDCSGETVVDFYAGIGYFTLPYLVHAGAAHVHACEWSSHALKALKRNLELNGVSGRCTVHEGDNRQLPLFDLADRVNLGLIPSSQDGWPIACRLLKQDTGGILHIHQNVTSAPHPSGPREAPALLPHPTNKPAGGQEVGIRSGPPQKKSGAQRETWTGWAEETADLIGDMLRDVSGRPWRTSVQHIEHVKSYAPHIHHLVLDLDCRPH